MATASSSIGPDSLINLKVNHDGITKKLKLPLRDLGASTLETKLCSLLYISPNDNVLIERYSDSAASFVVLDKANVSVFKQLYRAAKAKQKLKLRISAVVPKDVEEEHKVVPKPVTVEDVPEDSKAAEKAAEKAATPTLPAPVVPVPNMISNRVPSPQAVPFPNQPKLDGMLQQLQQNRAAVDLALENLAQEIRTRTSVPDLPPSWSPDMPERQLPMHLKRGTSSEAISRSTMSTARPTFAVCCNSCDENVPNTHYHCSTCDDGDFDLCESCFAGGVTCYDDSHWLIKRFVQDGTIINSTTERFPPKHKVKRPELTVEPPVVAPTIQVAASPIMQLLNVRTCNNCVGEFPETEFVHCTTCYDFDLCISCFDKNNHGHHPKHGFIPAVEGMALSSKTMARLEPGRHHKHNAVCDGCDKYICGVRHKCLDCPDWDYCATCVVNSDFIHPGHRFAPIYEGIKEVRSMSHVSRRAHYGICCDGPLCTTTGRGAYDTFIVGDRYKCAVCDNVDFCANCEASPANTHNKTHPLIKFKTPVRHVSVTTTGEHRDGKRLPIMGDRLPQSAVASPFEAEVPVTTPREVLSTNVQTVVDVMPTEETNPETESSVVKQETVQVTDMAAVTAFGADLNALFVADTVADGTVMAPNKVFEQTWVLRNSGPDYWPAETCVKFSGGDYMGHVDSNHPAHLCDLVSASESTIAYEAVAPGETRPFTVVLRAPTRPGKFISYWRLTTKDGVKFGDRLWCEIDVSEAKPKEEEEVEEAKDEPKLAGSEEASQSQMIFPKLEKESPSSSILEEAPSNTPTAKEETEDDFEECDLNEWDEAESEDGFLTDEEYDILDASDEEYLEEEQKKVAKK